ncbi:MAG: SPW repeat protein [Acidobacteriota bacterium]|nr:SPW repeat protein [Acidobacteriota bacterium]
MRFVPTRIHGIVDWLLGALLIALPWLLGFARGGPETYVPVALGSIGLLVTFFTDHEYGIVRRIPMSGHLAVDALAGAALAVSPWVLGFAETVWLPHLVLGVTELAAGFVTKTVPGDRPSAR